MTIKLTIWTPKGGVAKTTLTLNLAGALAADGKRVLVVDRDPQGGALAWARLAKQSTQFVVSSAYVAGFDVALFDLPPTLPDEIQGQLVMPTLLDAASHLLYLRGMSYAQQLGKDPVTVPARVRTDRAEQREILKAAFPDASIVRDRACYPRAYGLGKTVFDSLPIRGLHGARNEIRQILGRIA
jgi:chromosome partitioning protein